MDIFKNKTNNNHHHLWDAGVKQKGKGADQMFSLDTF